MSDTGKKWNTNLNRGGDRRRSELCKAMDWQAEWFRRWVAELREPARFHRKQWEFVYIMQALWERGCIAPGKKGLVFAVGTEPLPSLFANYGCDILATDIFTGEGEAKGWANGDQLCRGLASLNKRGLTDEATLQKHVQYRAVDMNHIPATLRNFDFNWSSCSFEHLGSISRGIAFLKNQLRTLRPGGWAVHTTEFNISSNDHTLESGDTVIFRMKDLEQLAACLRKEGHFVEELDYSLGGLPQDFDVDVFPHMEQVHLKLQLNEFVVTSIGLIIQKKKRFF
ncbi:methyltransferase domain-containing protein [Taibaiella koreensis]|uniref:methyltransferase domain-containing protein n=1 Tax=Taibaiella koreensis TaxID=1268548 RepID=UPI000E59AF6A|nr:methyltransferase domain-containing protein [Taibaiella koreensis]